MGDRIHPAVSGRVVLVSYKKYDDGSEPKPEETVRWSVQNTAASRKFRSFQIVSIALTPTSEMSIGHRCHLNHT